MALLMVNKPVLICFGLPGCEVSYDVILSNGAVINVILSVIVTSEIKSSIKNFLPQSDKSAVHTLFQLDITILENDCRGDGPQSKLEG